METLAERMQFVIRFAQMDLDTLRPGDWLNLRDDLSTFFQLGTAQPGDLRYLNKDPRAGIATGLQRRGSEVLAPIRLDLRHATEGIIDEDSMSDDVIRTIQAETRQAVGFVLATRVVPPLDGPGITIPVHWVDVHVQICHVNYDCFAPAGRGNSRVIQGAPRDVFLFLLSDLLIHEPIDRILRCPECEIIFYRVRKQQYCSRRCTNRANVRQWRQSEAQKQQETARAHNRYVKKKKREVGPGTRVARRPRKRSTAHVETPRQS